MDTQGAIATLQAIAATLADEVKGAQAKLDGVNLAISQLQGTLATQLTELETTKVELATANETIAALQPAPDPVPIVPTPVVDATSTSQVL